MARHGDSPTLRPRVGRVSPASLVGRLRSWLPTIEYGTCSGVRVTRPAEPRKLFDGLRPGRSTPEHLPFEGALVSVHREHVAPGDEVVIVGGGYGITTVAAAERADRVVVYEPDPRRLRTIRRTLALNDVHPATVSLRRRIVGELSAGEADRKGLDDGVAPTVEPADVPACDVLELDCEGAELSILRGLDRTSLPRVIAVEVHPIKLDGRASEVVPELVEMGYAIRRWMTHDGSAISQTAFRDLLAGETPDVGGEDHQEFPPVVVAERTSGGGE